VRELIEAVNRERLVGSPNGVSRLIPVNLECLLALRRAGLGPHSVPAAGEVVAVSESVSANGSQENETWRELSPALLDTARLAAEVARLRLAGIDLVTDDPAAPLEGHGAVLEVNATPGLHYHYQVRRPEACERVAVPLLDHLLA
jgi:cyanophycin synthetase